MSTQSERDARLQAMEERMQASYEKLMDRVYLQYHYHPSNLPHFDGDLGDLPGEEYRGYANGMHSGSKKVHLHTDKKHSNGLPRKGG